MLTLDRGDERMTATTPSATFATTVAMSANKTGIQVPVEAIERLERVAGHLCW